MGATRFSRDSFKDTSHVRGLLLAIALQPESVKLLLCSTLEEAKLFQDEARGRLAEIKERIKRAKAL